MLVHAVEVVVAEVAGNMLSAGAALCNPSQARMVEEVLDLQVESAGHHTGESSGEGRARCSKVYEVEEAVLGRILVAVCSFRGKIDMVEGTAEVVAPYVGANYGGKLVIVADKKVLVVRDRSARI